MLDVAFSALFLTDAKNVCFVEQTYKLTIHRLSRIKIWAKFLKQKILQRNASCVGNDLEMSDVHGSSLFCITKERSLFLLQRNTLRGKVSVLSYFSSLSMKE